MRGLTLENIAKACNGTYYGDASLKKVEVSSVTTDSRKVEKNCLFIAIKGQRSDGHAFIGQCLDNGAACCISEMELDEKRPYIKVSSSLQALKDIAAFYRSVLDVKVVGITGSVGKTSTKETVYSVLSLKYRTLKTLGNFNNEIGLPLTILRLRDEDEVAVLEMGISDFGEMSRLTAIARPDICIITNIGLCHLENLGTRDGILKAKTEIFESMDENDTFILNADDDKLITVTEVYGKKPVFFGIENTSGIYAVNIENCGLEGMKATLCNVDCADGVGSFDVSIPIAGNHMVYNAMAAAAAGAALGLTSKEIAAGISKVETIAGRNNIIKKNDLLILDDCYNANPVSMKSAIDVLATARGRKVAILGDMFELGENEEQLHYQTGQYFEGRNIDVLVAVGSLSKNLYYGANNYVPEKYYFQTRDEMLDDIGKILHKKDNILVKASHGMGFATVVEALTEVEINE